jgi:hypothetical protein
LISFFESAQNLEYNHLKYLEYYHIIEYFITKESYNYIKTSIKEFIAISIQGGSFEDLEVIIDKINIDLKNKNKDIILLEVIKKVKIPVILKIIKDFGLYESLKKNPFKKDISFMYNGNEEVNESEYEQFYSKLHKRIYSIRNEIVHSKANFKSDIDTGFLPTKENQAKLKDDVTLIKHIAIQLCLIECFDI